MKTCSCSATPGSWRKSIAAFFFACWSENHNATFQRGSGPCVVVLSRRLYDPRAIPTLETAGVNNRFVAGGRDRAATQFCRAEKLSGEFCAAIHGFATGGNSGGASV